MHEPFGRRRRTVFGNELAAVKTVAINPEPEPGLILDAEIIPCQSLSVLLPPFHGDALGAFDPHHRMGGPPPCKMMRRAVRNRCKGHVDRFRRLPTPPRA